ncbi:hypothetical protein OG21DRAFT_1607254, partial [Imleria badia]
MACPIIIYGWSPVQLELVMIHFRVQKLGCLRQVKRTFICTSLPGPVRDYEDNNFDHRCTTRQHKAVGWGLSGSSTSRGWKVAEQRAFDGTDSVLTNAGPERGRRAHKVGTLSERAHWHSSSRRASCLRTRWPPRRATGATPAYMYGLYVQNAVSVDGYTTRPPACTTARAKVKAATSMHGSMHEHTDTTVRVCSVVSAATGRLDQGLDGVRREDGTSSKSNSLETANTSIPFVMSIASESGDAATGSHAAAAWRVAGITWGSIIPYSRLPPSSPLLTSPNGMPFPKTPSPAPHADLNAKERHGQVLMTSRTTLTDRMCI